MKAPFILEDLYWKRVVSGKEEDIVALFNKDTMLKIDDKCLVGKQIVDFLFAIKCKSYVINNMQVVVSENWIVQAIYDARILVDGEPDRVYYISNTWIGSENEDSQEKLLFAYMISK